MSSVQKISLEAIPLVCEGVDLKGLNITPEEGFILSRLDGELRVRHLVMATGLALEQALKLIGGLVEKKIIILREPKPKKEPEAKKEKAKAPAKALINLKEIPKGQGFKELVKQLGEVIDKVDYFQLLGVSREAGVSEVKKAYFRYSKVFHPDRYYRKIEPEFRHQLQEIFKRINIAYQVLVDEERKEEYVKQLAEKGVEGAVEELKIEVIKKIHSGPKLKLGLIEDKEKAKEEKLKRMFEKIKSSPLQEQFQKAERLYELAIDELKRKNFKSARMNLKLAIQVNPAGEKKYKAELERIDRLEQENQAEVFFEEGKAAEDTGEYQKANRFYSEAIKISPENPKYIFRQAQIMIKYLNSFEKGRALLIMLLEKDSKQTEYYYLLGLAYKGLGQKRVAEVQFEKTLELDPKHKEAQKELKALKRA